jgi:hypothetical protein
MTIPPQLLARSAAAHADLACGDPFPLGEASSATQFVRDAFHLLAISSHNSDRNLNLTQHSESRCARPPCTNATQTKAGTRDTAFRVALVHGIGTWL